MGDNYYEAVSMLYGYGELMMEKTEYEKAGRKTGQTRSSPSEDHKSGSSECKES